MLLFDTQLKSISDVAVAFRSLGYVTNQFQTQQVGAALATQNLTKEQYAQMTAILGLSGETTKLSVAKIQEAVATGVITETQAANIITTLGLDAATKTYTASAIMAKVAVVGLNMAAGMFAGLLITGLFTGVAKVVEKVKEWNNQDKVLAESIKSLQQETTDITAELNKLNTELETTKAQIDEINASDNIEITSESDLAHLETQNELLEAQIALKERELELKNQETNEKIEDWYGEKWQKDTRGELQPEVHNGVTYDYYQEKTEEQYFQEQLARADELYKRQQELNDYKLSLKPEEIAAMSKEQVVALDLTEQEKKELEGIQTYLTKMTGELNQQVSGYTAVTDEQKQTLDYWNSIIIKAAKYSSFQMWTKNNSTDDTHINGEENKFSSLSEAMKAASDDIDKFQTNITTVFEKIHGQSEMTSTDIIDLMQETSEWGIGFDWTQFGITGEKGVGNLSAALQALGDELQEHLKNKYPQLSNQLDEIYQDAAKSADAFGTLDKALQSLADHHQVLEDTKKAIKDTGSISAETCNAILSAYPQMDSVVRDYLQGVATTSDVYNALSEAYQGDLDMYYECVLAKKELDYSFYKQVYDNLPTWVKEYLDAYQKDFGNFKNLAEAKIKLQEQFLNLEELSSLNSSDTTYLNYVRDTTNVKKKQLQEILGIIQDTELDVSGIKEPSFDSADNKDSDKDVSIKEIDWAANSIDNLSHHIEYLNNVIDNSNSYKERDSYLKQLISSQKKYNDALTEQAALYRDEYLNAVKKVPQYKELIESGATFEIETFTEQDDLYDAVTKAQELYTSWRDINTAQQDATKSLKEYEEQLDSNWIEHLVSEISLVQNEIDNIDSDISVDTEFHIIGDNKEILNSWKKEKYEQLLDLSAEMQLLLEQKLASYQRQLKDVKPETDEYYELYDSIAETKQAINDCAKSQREYNSAILSLPLEQYQKQLDLIDKHMDILNKSKDKYSEYIGAVTYSIDEEIKSINKSKESTEKYYESLIKPIQDQLDALQKTNDEREKALALQQAYYDLEKAENDLSVKTYVEGQGFIYRPDENAVREAQNSLDTALYDKAVYELEKQIKEYEDVRDALIKDYDDELDRLNDLNDSWSEIISQIEALAIINEFKLKFGDSTLTRILDGQDTSTIKNITEWVTAVQGELDTLEVKKGNLEDVIDTCELIVESYEDGSIDVDTAMNKIDDVVTQHTKSITTLNQEHVESVIKLGNEYKNSLFNFGESEDELTNDTEDSSNKMRNVIGKACSHIKDAYDSLSRSVSSLRDDMVSNLRSISGAASNMASDVASAAASANSALADINTDVQIPETTPKTTNPLLPILPGIIGVIGGLIFKHDGMESGLVSADQSEEHRDSVFKRIALEDLKANEVPAILQDGEAVLTRKQQDNVVRNMVAGVDYGMNAVRSIGKTSNVNVNIPEIHLHEIQNVDSFAKEISKTFKTRLIQEVRK